MIDDLVGILLFIIRIFIVILIYAVGISLLVVFLPEIVAILFWEFR